jgi:hypothetical protein
MEELNWFMCCRDNRSDWQKGNLLMVFTVISINKQMFDNGHYVKIIKNEKILFSGLSNVFYSICWSQHSSM